ncbi:hypothetical protein J7J08_08825 [Stenotrophomonas sp. ISL-67]|uniref:hypothetical protein n=1 Tax=Stenotrophomonas sp. ISL-67 TaxID=2819171 RepID=UPI001BE97E34|nr:hypothetical protein [Stenotrophomonas sp. ISL-67]MBT2767742.1 hypothetical protein [Stenotrophomonas sp. ISL-67]
MTLDELRNHLRTLDLCEEDRAFALELYGQDAGRRVGTYALDNVIVDFHSRKCRDVRQLESHTVEQTFAFELELDPDVISYVCQVTCRGVRRGRHVSAAHADFFVIRKSSAEVIECKPISKLDRLIATKPEEWLKHDGRYRNLVYERWATSHGLSHRVWASPANIGRYHRNLQFIYQNWDEELSLVRREGFADVKRLLAAGPMSIEDLMLRIAWFNAGVAAGFIADRLLYGPIEHVPITDTRSFILTLNADQAALIAKDISNSITDLYLDASGPASTASATDAERGRLRLAKLDKCDREGSPIPRSMRRMHRSVLLARAEGRNPLHETVTRYVRSGNRSSRLTVPQTNMISGVIRTHWLKGVVSTISELHRELVLQCHKEEIQPPGRKALVRRVRMTSRAVHDLAVGGKRQYQANRPRSDARFRSGTALAVHAVLHLDATKIDHRTFIQGEDGMEDICPLLYCGRDEASGLVMAHAFVFGPARRDGPLLLIRNYVRKHGQAPHTVVIDRGTDLKSGLSEMCRIYGISILTVPTGGCRFNSQCETIQGQINAMVSHKLIGSTKPDQAGRSVDGKFKSRATARMEFSVTESQICSLLYEVLPGLPAGDLHTPEERFGALQSVAPTSGIPVAFDDDFRFNTSIKLNSRTYDRVRGFRHIGISYTNSELAARSEVEKILEARRDPEDTSFVWIQTSLRRYKAWCSKVSSIGHYSAEDRHFEAMWDRFIRPDVDAVKERIQRDNYERTSLANQRQRTAEESQELPTTRPDLDSENTSEVGARLLGVDFDGLPDLLCIRSEVK